VAKKTFTESVADAAESWRINHNASLRAQGLSGERTLGDSDEFMRDIAPGWITEDKHPYGAEGFALEDLGWLGKLDPDWMKGLPKESSFETALQHVTDIKKRIPGILKSTVEKMPPHERDKAFLGTLGAAYYSSPEHVGRYSGTGSLGTPVYTAPSEYVSSYNIELDENVGKGFLGAFAPEGDWIRSQPRTGTLAHELGHAKIRKLGTRVPSNMYNFDAQQATNEAVAGYLGRRIIRSRKPWGEASDDKSWAAYMGLPSYLRDLDEYDLTAFGRMLKDYEKGYKRRDGEVIPGYPGLYKEVMRAINEYDTLVAPKDINDTSRGTWSKEGLEYMKKWRKEKGLKEVPEGNLYERALEAGPYSMQLKGAMTRRLS